MVYTDIDGDCDGLWLFSEKMQVVRQLAWVLQPPHSSIFNFHCMQFANRSTKKASDSTKTMIMKMQVVPQLAWVDHYHSPPSSLYTICRIGTPLQLDGSKHAVQKRLLFHAMLSIRQNTILLLRYFCCCKILSVESNRQNGWRVQKFRSGDCVISYADYGSPCSIQLQPSCTKPRSVAHQNQEQSCKKWLIE